MNTRKQWICLFIAGVAIFLFLNEHTLKPMFRTHISEVNDESFQNEQAIDTRLINWSLFTFNGLSDETANFKVPLHSPPYFFIRLIELESKFGGIVTNVPRGNTSKLDPRLPSELIHTTLTGGDRMNPFFHNYGIHYAKYLSRLTRISKVTTIAEIGILRGTGVAVFADLFPEAFVYGFDIDLEYIKSNMIFLKKRGAFRNNNLVLKMFDQFQPKLSLSKKVNFSIVIDDGVHNDRAILSTFKVFYPFLQPMFLYVVEDCICTLFRHYIKHNHNTLVVEHFKMKTGSEITFILPKELGYH